ncbi:spore coat protein GerQ [Paenibacillus sp. GCM10023248]|uniref:spore coat protein GerQ n=1 Tax=Bacillales TaxID=1385 RepID=UPI0023781D93|nr:MULTISPECIES: spore coat protein GerQ [Bacillales]MDD9271269.1 spore coat protein GerQ [Paenibacillus sp. MAHUQ-63]MDR6881609.1 spore germination protein Q [Bacillus sp. 3255]
MLNNPYKIGNQAQMPSFGGTPYPAYPVPTAIPNKVVPQQPAGSMVPPPGTGLQTGVNIPGLQMEESYIENILRLNLGKMATLYMTYENNSEWNAKIFKGKLEAAGRDHIIISDPATGMRFLLLMVNLDYITFDEELNYYYPYAQRR